MTAVDLVRAALLVSAFWIAACSQSPRSTLVFAAVSTREPVRELARECERSGLGKIDVSLGASNDLARQIEAGAPADVFLSADRAQMDRLEKSGKILGATRTDLLSNELVVIQPANASPINSPEALERVSRLAIADPRSVPVGVYARAWLERRGQWGALEPKVVPTLDARATLAAVATGAAEAGIVYRTDAATSDRVRVVYRVPREEVPPIAYPIARLVRAPSAKAAGVLGCLTGATAKAAFERSGFVWIKR